MEKLQNKTILITGANRGIGKSLVKAALAKGAGKIYATSRGIKNLPDFGDDRVVPLEFDITDNNQIEYIAAKASDTQVLINNAGVLNPGTVLEGDMEGKQKDMEVNYFATINMMRAFAPILEKNTPARMVNIVSIAAYSPLPFIAGYAASKAALFSATQAVRIELAKKGITVHSVSPGAIDTDMNKGSEWEMPAPDGIAEIILSEVENGVLDIIPDDMGKGMYNSWREAPSNLAQTFHDMYHGEE
ncbi:SDR family oxidoreductase [Flavobacterium litorale]|uniref:SDR family oxidoreductase n=1 Tax=Flavobacterium litorale TaxID=2856519 RepID=A0ABX8V6F0_9FLAO|nr:SDR family oxidoreductase [Flavobacterium litorale]QYJ68390.1 SDR family oxidoreductase [Flavobacterium litorale]